MQLNSVEQIASAIQALTPEERNQLYARLDASIDELITKDLDAGRFDSIIAQALEDERSGRTRPL